jgi:hypothetical protein
MVSNINIVLRSTEKEVKKDLNSYPLSFVILLATLGLCLGAYLNKITDKWV